MPSVEKEVTSVDSIVEALGAVKVKTDSKWSTTFVYNNIVCMISDKNNKFHIWVCRLNGDLNVNHYESDKIYDESCMSVNVANTRQADQIAKDFIRRIQWDEFGKYATKFKQEVKERVDHINSTLLFASEIADIIGQGISKNPSGDMTTQYVEAKGEWYSLNRSPIAVSSDSVDLQLRNIKNREMVLELATVIAKYVNN